MPDLKVVPRMTRRDAIMLRAFGLAFMKSADRETDPMVAMGERCVGRAALAKAEEALRQLDAWQGTGGS